MVPLAGKIYALNLTLSKKRLETVTKPSAVAPEHQPVQTQNVNSYHQCPPL